MSAQGEVVLGRIPVLECLKAGIRKPRKLLVQRDARGIEAILDAARGVPVETVTRPDLDQQTRGAVHQGVLLQAAPLPVLDERAWLARDLAPDAVAMLLDGIEDPQNFGAIVRSAAASGACAVVFAKDRAAPLSPAALKAAAGAMEHIPLVRVTNLVRCIERMKESGFWIAALDADAPDTLWDARLDDRIGLIAGSEGKGVRRLVYANCDLRLRIPIEGPITSLNASVSAAIALAECRRQRWVKARDAAPRA